MPNPGPNERLSELVERVARAIHETMWVEPGPWPCDDESHLDGGCTNYVTGQAEAALTAAGVPELLRENERLRRRTHEISEAADKRQARLESDVAHHRRCREQAAEAVAAYGADWAGAKGEPGTLFSHSSQNTKDAFTKLIEEREALLRVVEAVRADHYQNERLIELNRCWCGEDATECRYLVALEALPTEPPMKGEAITASIRKNRNTARSLRHS